MSAVFLPVRQAYLAWQRTQPQTFLEFGDVLSGAAAPPNTPPAAASLNPSSVGGGRDAARPAFQRTAAPGKPLS